MFVQVIVDIPAAQVNRTFDYLVPEELVPLIQLGIRVQVPFGTRQLLAFVVGISDRSEFAGKLKPISAVMDYESFINEELLELSQVLATQLNAFRITLLQAMLPSMLRVKYTTKFRVHQLAPLQATWELAPETIYLAVEEVEQRFSRKQIKQWLSQGVLELLYEVEEDRKSVV